MAIDTWLVVAGKLNVWAGDQGRVLCAGDFAFVPPGITHSYQVIEPHTEFMGLIHPAEWVDFFRAIGEIWKDAAPFPSNDTREFPKDRFIKAIKDGHDVMCVSCALYTVSSDGVHSPQFAHRFGDAQASWTGNAIPEQPEAYWLKAHVGPRYALGGQTLAPMCYASTSLDKFSISTLEGSSSISHPSELSTLKAPRTLIAVSNVGSWQVTVDGKAETIRAGDSIHIPAGATFSFAATSRLARAYLFHEGKGLEELFMQVGVPIKGVIGCEVPEMTAAVKEQFSAKAKELGFA